MLIGYLDIYGDTIGPKTQTNSDENELLKKVKINWAGYFHPGNISNKMLWIFWGFQEFPLNLQ